MNNKITELVKNANFDLRLLECIACLVYIILSYTNVTEHFWPVQGWFLISLAFIMGYLFEKPKIGLEIVLIITFYISMKNALIYSAMKFPTWHLIPAFIAILMFIDLIILIYKER